MCVLGLNELVSANARLALKMESARRAIRQERFSRRLLAREMGKALGRDPESIYRQLSHLLRNPPARVWRIDYIEAFALCVGVRAADLLSPSFGAGIGH
jgi:hypothetical protein